MADNAPLTGVRILEFGGLGPGPFGNMMLSDLGADVIRVERVRQAGQPASNLFERGRRSITIDIKAARGREIVHRLVKRCDVLTEGFRPGVMERLGYGPDHLTRQNPQLIYARITGWGQESAMAARAGHDINYIAISGVLDSIGRAGSAPTVPLNFLGDLAGGGMLLAVGVLSALVARGRNGRGEVIDVAMTDGSALLMTHLFGTPWFGPIGPRGENVIDSGAPFYDVYRTADDRYVAVGALEDKFYAELLRGLQLDVSDLGDRWDRSTWPELRRLIESRFRAHPRDYWAELFADVDACVSPVLSREEAIVHPQNVSRGTFRSVQGVVQPSPAPRFRTMSQTGAMRLGLAGTDTQDVLLEVGLSSSEIDDLVRAGVVATGAATSTDTEEEQ